MNRRLIYTLLLPVWMLMGCSTSFEEIKHSNGNADFSRLVAVGGSYMSGYADWALYNEAQQNSVPAIIASRLAFAEGGAMVQPLMNPGVGIGIKGNAHWAFALEASGCGGESYIDSKPVASQGDASSFNWLGNSVAFNNLSVPNTRIKDVTSQSFGNPSPFLGNPFYARFATNPGVSTITGDALQINPTFVMVWMGLEDVFSYACKGGAQGGDSVTAPSVFAQKYSNLVNELTSLGAKGVLLTVPQPGTIPFFRAIRYNGLYLTAAEAASLNALYAVVDSSISFIPGYNPYVIADAAQPTGRRQVKAGEYLLLSMPKDSLDCEDWGTTIPIPAYYVLDQTEVAQIEQAVNAYNATIVSAAAAKNLAVADMNSLFLRMNTGITFNGASYSSSFPEGGLFSTDGLYPSQRGYAFISNEVINSINRKYNATVPLFDVNSVPGVQLP
jgi:hypothetical protein